MSIADHFEHAPDAGFVRDYDSESARRQFKVSLVLIVVIAIAATALSVLIRFDGPTRVNPDARASQPMPSQPMPSQPMPSYVGKL